MNRCFLCRAHDTLTYSIPLNFLLCSRIFSSTDLQKKYKICKTEWVDFLDLQMIVLQLIFGFSLLHFFCWHSLIFSVTVKPWKFKGNPLEECFQSFWTQYTQTNDIYIYRETLSLSGDRTVSSSQCSGHHSTPCKVASWKWLPCISTSRSLQFAIKSKVIHKPWYFIIRIKLHRTYSGMRHNGHELGPSKRWTTL